MRSLWDLERAGRPYRRTALLIGIRLFELLFALVQFVLPVAFVAESHGGNRNGRLGILALDGPIVELVNDFLAFRHFPKHGVLRVLPIQALGVGDNAELRGAEAIVDAQSVLDVLVLVFGEFVFEMIAL